jgi:uncharacterized OB-fold protein
MSAPKYWREIPQRYRFEAAKCKECGKVLFPPRLACPNCKSREFDQVKINDKGTIETYTVVRIAPTGFTDNAPYPVAIVNMGDDVRVLCQVADIDLEELKIGMPVRLEFRLIQKEGPAGILAYGYKCVPE